MDKWEKMKRREWWQRGMNAYFRKQSRNPTELKKEIIDFAKERQRKTKEFELKFQADVERLRKRLMGEKFRSR